MEFTKKQGLAAAVAAGLVAWGAQASAAEPGLYLGVGIGDASVETTEKFENPFASFDVKKADFDDSDTSMSLFGGYRFNDYFAVELGYTDLGEPEDGFSFDGGETAKLTGELTGWTADLVGILPLGPVDVFAKAGLVSYDAKVNAKVTDGLTTLKGSLDDDGEDLHYGIGATLNLGPVGVGAQYEIWDVSDIDDVSILSLRGQFNF
jgi:hypothetical protein